MNKTYTQYSEEEDAVVRAGATLGKTPAQIAWRLPERTPASVRARAIALGLSLSDRSGPPRIPRSGHVGVAIRDDVERAEAQDHIDTIAEKQGFTTHKDVYLYALRVAAKHVAGQ